MNAEEFNDFFRAWNIRPDDLLMVRDRESGVMYSIKNVVLETYGEEATIGATCWIEVEEY